MADSEEQLVESIYAATLDPAALDITVQRWVDRLGNTSIEQPDSDAFQAENHMTMAVALLERLNGPSADDKATPTLRIGFNGVVISVNEAAQAVYQLAPGARAEDLPLDGFAHSEIRKFSIACRQPGKKVERRAFLAQRTDRPGRLLAVLEQQSDGYRISTTEVIWDVQQATLLLESFELTDAEVDVVRLLIEGHGVEQIAEVRGASVATVRTQIRRIYDKTGAGSMPELIRFMVGLSATLYAGPGDEIQTKVSDEGAAPFPRDDQSRLFVLPDGRRLEYSILGAEDGQPVLFMHDEICVDGWTAEGVAMLQARQLKLVAPLRPHYGRTDPLPQGSNMPSSQIAEDILVLMDALGIEQVTLLARVMGNIAAMQLLEIAPERIKGVVSVAPPLPMRDEAFRQLNPLLRMMFFASMHSPAMARFIVKTRHAFAQRYGARRYLESHYPHPWDRKLLEDPQVYSAIMHGARALAEKGVDGYLSDVSSTGRYTSAGVAALLRRPVTFVVGEQDQNHRRERVLGVIEEGANAELMLLSDACDLVFYRHTETILDRVLSYASA